MSAASSQQGPCPHATNAPQGLGTAVCRRRDPATTVLCQVVQQNLETFLALSAEGDPMGEWLPGFVERDLRKFLDCGILARGFARARCGCGHDFLIAFSCKGPGVCPSCGTRRMAATALRLLEDVLPRVPVRQWVLSVPKRLRFHLHRDPVLAGAGLRIVLRAVERELRGHCPDAPPGARTGAVTFIQRFGGTIYPW
ncbi:MAG: hypothetical protein GY778_03015 [bacterium]|nr:hypothetical protein [bacterium]